ncbi:hypothetical protein EBR43_01385, partial [bacterium]|nr:hypothetical protein [bacterium]
MDDLMIHDETFSSKNFLGIVEAIHGSVFIKRANSDKFVQLKVGDKIYKGDQLDEQQGQIASLYTATGTLLSQQHHHHLIEALLSNNQEVLTVFTQQDNVLGVFPEEIQSAEDDRSYRGVSYQNLNNPIISIDALDESISATQGSDDVYFVAKHDPNFKIYLSEINQDDENLDVLFAPIPQGLINPQDEQTNTFKVIAENLLLDTDTNTVYFYTSKSLVPLFVFQENVNQSFMERFVTNSYSSYLLSDFFTKNLGNASPFKMLFQGSLAVDFSNLRAERLTTLPSTSSQNQFVLLDYTAAPISTENLEKYRLELTFPSRVNLNNLDIGLTPIITDKGWLATTALSLDKKWQPVGAVDSLGSALQWEWILPAEAFNSTVDDHSYNLLSSTIADLNQIINLFTGSSSTKNANSFVHDYISKINTLDLNNKDVGESLTRTFMNDFIDPLKTTYSGGQAQYVFKAGITFDLAIRAVNQLLRAEISLEQNVLNQYNLPPTIGKQMVLIAPTDAVPAGTKLDLQMQSSVSDFDSVLVEPIFIETVSSTSAKTDDVNLVDAYNYFAKQIINADYSPLASSLKIYNPAKEVGNNFSNASNLTQQWIFDGYELTQNGELKISLILNQGSQLSAINVLETLSSTLSNVSSMQMGELLTQAYQQAIGSVVPSHDLVSGRHPTIIISPATAIVYDPNTYAFKSYAAFSSPTVGAGQTFISNPIGLSDSLAIKNIQLNSSTGLSLLKNIQGYKYFSYDSLVQNAASAGAISLYVTYPTGNFTLPLNSNQLANIDSVVQALSEALALRSLGHAFVPMGATFSYNNYLQVNAFFPEVASAQNSSLTNLNTLLSQVALDEGQQAGSIRAIFDSTGKLVITGPLDLSNLLFFNNNGQTTTLQSQTTQFVDSPIQYLGLTGSGNTAYTLKINDLSVIPNLFYRHYNDVASNATNTDLLNMTQSVQSQLNAARSFVTLLNGSSSVTQDTLVKTSNFLAAQSLGEAAPILGYDLNLGVLSDQIQRDFQTQDNQKYTFTTQGLTRLGTWSINEIPVNNQLTVIAEQTVTASSSLSIDGSAITLTEVVNGPKTIGNITVTKLGSNQNLYLVEKKASPGADGLKSITPALIIADGRVVDGHAELKIKVDTSSTTQLTKLLNQLNIHFVDASLLNSNLFNQLQVQLNVAAIEDKQADYEKTLTFSVQIDELTGSAIYKNGTNNQDNNADPNSDPGTDPNIVTPASSLLNSFKNTQSFSTVGFGKNSIANSTTEYLIKYHDPYVLNNTVNELGILEKKTKGISTTAITKQVDSVQDMIAFVSPNDFQHDFFYLDPLTKKIVPLAQSELFVLAAYRSVNGDTSYQITGTAKDFANICTLLPINTSNQRIIDLLVTKNESNSIVTLTETAETISNKLALALVSNNHVSNFATPTNPSLSLLLTDWNASLANNQLDALVAPDFKSQLSILPHLLSSQSKGALDIDVLVNGQDIANSSYQLVDHVNQLTAYTTIATNPYLQAYNAIVGMSNPQDQATYQQIKTFISVTEHLSSYNVFDYKEYVDLFITLAEKYNAKMGSQLIDTQKLVTASLYTIIPSKDYIVSADDAIRIKITNYSLQSALLANINTYDKAVNYTTNELADLESLLGYNNSITKYVIDPDTNTNPNPNPNTDLNPNNNIITFSSTEDFGQNFVYLRSSTSEPESLAEALNYSYYAGLYSVSGTAEQLSKIYVIAAFNVDTTVSGSPAIVESADGLTLTLSGDTNTISVAQTLASRLTNVNYLMYNNGHFYQPNTGTTAQFARNNLDNTFVQDNKAYFIPHPESPLIALKRNPDVTPFDYGILGFSEEHSVFLPLKIQPNGSIINFAAGDVTLNGVSLDSFSLNADGSNISTVLPSIKTQLAAAGSSLGSEPTFNLHFYNNPAVDNVGFNQNYLVFSNNNNLPITVELTSLAEQSLGLSSTYVNVGIGYHHNKEFDTLEVIYSYPQGVRSGSSLDAMPVYDNAPNFYVIPSTIPLNLNNAQYLVYSVDGTNPSSYDTTVTNLLAFFRMLDKDVAIQSYSNGSVIFNFTQTKQIIESKLQTLSNGSYAAVTLSGTSSHPSLTVNLASSPQYAFDIKQDITPLTVNSIFEPIAGDYIVNMFGLTVINNLALFNHTGTLISLLQPSMISAANLNYLDTDSDKYTLDINSKIDYIHSPYYQKTDNTQTVGSVGSTNTLDTILTTKIKPAYNQMTGIDSTPLAITRSGDNLVLDGGYSSTSLITEATASSYLYNGSISPDITLVASRNQYGQWFYKDTTQPIESADILLKTSSATPSALSALFGVATANVSINGSTVTVSGPSNNIYYNGVVLSSSNTLPSTYTYSASGVLTFNTAQLGNFSAALPGSVSTLNDHYKVSWINGSTSYSTISVTESSDYLHHFQNTNLPSGLIWSLKLKDDQNGVLPSFTQGKGGGFDGSQTVAFELNTSGMNATPYYRENLWAHHNKVLISNETSNQPLLTDLNYENYLFNNTIQPDILLKQSASGNWFYAPNGWSTLSNPTVSVSLKGTTSLTTLSSDNKKSFFGTVLTPSVDSSNATTVNYLTNSTARLSYKNTGLNNVDGSFIMNAYPTAQISATTPVSGQNSYNFAQKLSADILLIPTNQATQWFVAGNWNTVPTSNNNVTYVYKLVATPNYTSNTTALTTLFNSSATTISSNVNNTIDTTIFNSLTDSVTTNGTLVSIHYAPSTVLPNLFYGAATMATTAGFNVGPSSNPISALDKFGTVSPDILLQKSNTGYGTWYYNPNTGSSSWANIANGSQTVTLSLTSSATTAANQETAIKALYNNGTALGSIVNQVTFNADKSVTLNIGSNSAPTNTTYSGTQTEGGSGSAKTLTLGSSTEPFDITKLSTSISAVLSTNANNRLTIKSSDQTITYATSDMTADKQLQHFTKDSAVDNTLNLSSSIPVSSLTAYYNTGASDLTYTAQNVGFDIINSGLYTHTLYTSNGALYTAQNDPNNVYTVITSSLVPNAKTLVYTTSTTVFDPTLVSRQLSNLSLVTTTSGYGIEDQSGHMIAYTDTAQLSPLQHFITGISGLSGQTSLNGTSAYTQNTATANTAFSQGNSRVAFEILNSNKSYNDYLYASAVVLKQMSSTTPTLSGDIVLTETANKTSWFYAPKWSDVNPAVQDLNLSLSSNPDYINNNTALTTVFANTGSVGTATSIDTSIFKSSSDSITKNGTIVAVHYGSTKPNLSYGSTPLSTDTSGFTVGPNKTAINTNYTFGTIFPDIYLKNETDGFGQWFYSTANWSTALATSIEVKQTPSGGATSTLTGVTLSSIVSGGKTYLTLLNSSGTRIAQSDMTINEHLQHFTPTISGNTLSIKMMNGSTPIAAYTTQPAAGSYTLPASLYTSGQSVGFDVIGTTSGSSPTPTYTRTLFTISSGTEEIYTAKTDDNNLYSVITTTAATNASTLVYSTNSFDPMLLTRQVSGLSLSSTSSGYQLTNSGFVYASTDTPLRSGLQHFNGLNGLKAAFTLSSSLAAPVYRFEPNIASSSVAFTPTSSVAFMIQNADNTYNNYLYAPLLSQASNGDLSIYQTQTLTSTPIVTTTLIAEQNKLADMTSSLAGVRLGRDSNGNYRLIDGLGYIIASSQSDAASVLQNITTTLDASLKYEASITGTQVYQQFDPYILYVKESGQNLAFDTLLTNGLYQTQLFIDGQGTTGTSELFTDNPASFTTPQITADHLERYIFGDIVTPDVVLLAAPVGPWSYSNSWSTLANAPAKVGFQPFNLTNPSLTFTQALNNALEATTYTSRQDADNNITSSFGLNADGTIAIPSSLLYNGAAFSSAQSNKTTYVIGQVLTFHTSVMANFGLTPMTVSDPTSVKTLKDYLERHFPSTLVSVGLDGVINLYFNGVPPTNFKNNGNLLFVGTTSAHPDYTLTDLQLTIPKVNAHNVVVTVNNAKLKLSGSNYQVVDASNSVILQADTYTAGTIKHFSTQPTKYQGLGVALHIDQTDSFIEPNNEYSSTSQQTIAYEVKHNGIYQDYLYAPSGSTIKYSTLSLEKYVYDVLNSNAQALANNQASPFTAVTNLPLITYTSGSGSQAAISDQTADSYLFGNVINPDIVLKSASPTNGGQWLYPNTTALTNNSNVALVLSASENFQITSNNLQQMFGATRASVNNGVISLVYNGSSLPSILYYDSNGFSVLGSLTPINATATDYSVMTSDNFTTLSFPQRILGNFGVKATSYKLTSKAEPNNPADSRYVITSFDGAVDKLISMMDTKAPLQLFVPVNELQIPGLNYAIILTNQPTIPVYNQYSSHVYTGHETVAFETYASSSYTQNLYVPDQSVIHYKEGLPVNNTLTTPLTAKDIISENDRYFVVNLNDRIDYIYDLKLNGENLPIEFRYALPYGTGTDNTALIASGVNAAVPSQIIYAVIGSPVVNSNYVLKFLSTLDPTATLAETRLMDGTVNYTVTTAHSELYALIDSTNSLSEPTLTTLDSTRHSFVINSSLLNTLAVDTTLLSHANNNSGWVSIDGTNNQKDLYLPGFNGANIAMHFVTSMDAGGSVSEEQIPKILLAFDKSDYISPLNLEVMMGHLYNDNTGVAHSAFVYDSTQTYTGSSISYMAELNAELPALTAGTTVKVAVDLPVVDASTVWTVTYKIDVDNNPESVYSDYITIPSNQRSSLGYSNATGQFYKTYVFDLPVIANGVQQPQQHVFMQYAINAGSISGLSSSQKSALFTPIDVRIISTLNDAIHVTPVHKNSGYLTILQNQSYIEENILSDSLINSSQTVIRSDATITIINNPQDSVIAVPGGIIIPSSSSSNQVNGFTNPTLPANTSSTIDPNEAIQLDLSGALIPAPNTQLLNPTNDSLSDNNNPVANASTIFTNPDGLQLVILKPNTTSINTTNSDVQGSLLPGQGIVFPTASNVNVSGPSTTLSLSEGGVVTTYNSDGSSSTQTIPPGGSVTTPQNG